MSSQFSKQTPVENEIIKAKSYAVSSYASMQTCSDRVGTNILTYEVLAPEKDKIGKVQCVDCINSVLYDNKISDGVAWSPLKDLTASPVQGRYYSA